MKVSIAKIRPNPFQVRKHLDPASIKALAREIDTLGFWTPLRVRQVDGHYELCFGHRRLEALKVLKWKDVDVDLVKLSDDDMAIQALVENFQREGLTDIEKADGIRQLAKQLDPDSDQITPRARSQIMALMGLRESRFSELLQLKTLGKTSQRRIADKKISGKTAVQAHRLGGDEMVETAITHELSQHQIEHIARELTKIPDTTVREKVKRAVIAGKVRDPETVRAQASKVSRQTAERAGKRPPPDLLIVIRSWTKTMIAWAKRLEEVEPYRDYIDSEPETAGEFKAATRELIDKLKRFL